MEKYKNINEYLQENKSSKEDLKEMLLRTALDLLGDCAHNFEGDASVTERTALPLLYLNDILDKVE